MGNISASEIATWGTLVATIGSGFYFIGSLNNRVKVMEKEAEKNAAEHKCISDVAYQAQREVAGLTATMEAIKEVVYRIDDKLDRLAEGK